MIKQTIWKAAAALAMMAGVSPAAISIGQIAAIRYPTEPAWSPDGKTVAFLWDAAGVQNLFAVHPGEKPFALTDFAGDPDLKLSNVGNFEWLSPDELLFGKDGQLFRVSLTTRKPSRVRIEGAGGFTLSPDKQQIAFARRGQLYIASLATLEARQLTRLAEGLSAGAAQFSPDGRSLSFSASRGGQEAEELRYNGDRMRTYRNVGGDSQAGVISVFGGDPTWLPVRGEGRGGNARWINNDALLVESISPDRKTREIKIAGLDGTARTLWKDRDSAWWSPTGGARTTVSPDGKFIAFFSDRTGWVHLYVLPVDSTSESQARQLTTGSFGTGYATWSPDSKRIAYAHSVEGNQMERFLAVVDAVTGKSEEIVSEPGVNFDPAFSSDGKWVAYSRTSVQHSLELYTAAAQPGAKGARLTDSMGGISPADLTAPVPVKFPSRVDGKPVPATIIASKTLDKSKKHPAIVWIHGSGSDQNYLGWHPGSYRMYYSMHQYLAQKGYVILTPDYRGSSGYSRDWATGHYMDLGGADYLDVASGADYLKTLEYVDPDRIGVWGLSYGGFMTLQAVTVTPKLFRAAIDVAGVGDWGTWSTGGWITGRMGTPISNPEGFFKSASVKHMEKLERPLLVLHGTADTNVAFRESLTLVDTLLKLGKPFDMSIYPGEPHFFRREHVLEDAWRRAEEFFDRHLIKGTPLHSAD